MCLALSTSRSVRTANRISIPANSFAVATDTRPEAIGRVHFISWARSFSTSCKSLMTYTADAVSPNETNPQIRLNKFAVSKNSPAKKTGKAINKFFIQCFTRINFHISFICQPRMSSFLFYCNGFKHDPQRSRIAISRLMQLPLGIYIQQQTFPWRKADLRCANRLPDLALSQDVFPI